MIKKTASTLRETVKVLRQYYGSPAQLPTANPFELILLENVAYLSSPARRREAFELLRRTIGTEPIDILAAESQALEDVTAKGILKRTFAAKLRQCALIAVDDFGGDLGSVIKGPLESAKRALRSFPGIGEPGAEKILLFTGQQALLAPDSNGLRVLVRLGLVREEKTYARTYAASREVAQPLSTDPGVMQEAHLLLQQHGQTLCKRSVPHCEACPLAPSCAYAAANRARNARPGQPAA
jgi:endonuclease III